MAVPLRFALVVILIGITCGAPATTPRPSGIDSCSGKPNGKYHKYGDCRYYIECTGGSKREVKCPYNEYFDVDKKGCTDHSKSCAKTREIGLCVSECEIQQHGDYQHCTDCTKFITCWHGNTAVMNCSYKHPVPERLVWDDDVKRCEWESTTCSGKGSTAPPPPVTTTTPKTTTTGSTGGGGTGGDCTNDCIGKSDGTYHACDDCRYYTQCSWGSPSRKSCGGKYWDNNKKECTWDSKTCSRVRPTGKCVDECKMGMHGNYQHCDNCQKFIICSNGHLSEMSCAEGGTFWDDKEKECIWTSTTCSGKGSTAPPPPVTTTTPKTTTTGSTGGGGTGGDCTNDCIGKSDGTYHACDDCRYYTQCSGGSPSRKSCGGKYWDNNKKECTWDSKTCSRVRPTGDCVDKCDPGMHGDYQHCDNCQKFITCSNGQLHEMPCAPGGTFWDDKEKECIWTSTTCSGKGSTAPPPPVTTTTPKTTTTGSMGGGGTEGAPTTTESPTHPPPLLCPGFCHGKEHFVYQHCSNCHLFIHCAPDGQHEKWCPKSDPKDDTKRLVWDDNIKTCNWHSDTCPGTGPDPSTDPPNPGDCVDDCTGLADGDYQSCDSCNHYVSCVAGGIYKMRPCAPSDPPLCWDDKVKRCEWTSTTCPCGDPPPKPSTTAHPPLPESSTPPTSPPTSPPTPPPTPECPTCAPETPQPPTPAGCAYTCRGRPDGDYQSCKACHLYVSCCNGKMFGDRICPPGLLWDDYKKGCYYKSDTCRCPDDCSD